MEISSARAPGSEVLNDNPAGGELLASCRLMLRREGAQSPSARALFHQFYDNWYGRVEAWSASRIGNFYSQDLAVETFWRAWQWLLGSSELPGPASLLNTCLERAHADMMRSLYGRHPSGRGQGGQPGADARFPLSADRVDSDTRALIQAIASEHDVEIEALQHERASLVREALAAIEVHYRDCVRCRYLLGMSVHDTAVELRLTTDQVKKRTAYGLARLAAFILRGDGQ